MTGKGGKTRITFFPCSVLKKIEQSGLEVCEYTSRLLFQLSCTSMSIIRSSDVTIG